MAACNVSIGNPDASQYIQPQSTVNEEVRMVTNHDGQNLPSHSPKKHTRKLIRETKQTRSSKIITINQNVLTECTTEVEESKPVINGPLIVGGSLESFGGLPRDYKELIMDQEMPHKKKKNTKANEQQYRCELCTMTFTKKSQLKAHNKLEHPSDETKSHLCDICGKKFTQQLGLQYHKEVHRDQEIITKIRHSVVLSPLCNDDDYSLPCFLCQKTTKRLIRWLHHLKHHLDDPQLGDTERQQINQILQDQRTVMDESRVFPCIICDHLSFYSTEHRLHLDNHNSSKELGCNQCINKFSTKSSLRYHVRRVHQRLKCKDCEARFGKLADLKEHELSVHERTSKEEFFVCEETDCNYKSKSEKRLQFHMFHDHGHRQNIDKAFLCSICRKSFATKYALQIHERTHTRNKVYLCTVCGRGFTDPSNLVHHGKRKHPEVPRETFSLKSEDLSVLSSEVPVPSRPTSSNSRSTEPKETVPVTISKYQTERKGNVIFIRPLEIVNNK